MSSEHNELKVGITVTVVVILFVAVLVFIGRWDTLFARTKTLTVRFNHSAGIQNLRVKDPVRIGGVNVGRVQDIAFREIKEKVKGITHDQLYVYVKAYIPSHVTLYKDVKISIGTKFVGEGATLDILDAGNGMSVLTPGQVVEGQAPAGFAELTSKISRELDDASPDSLLSQIKNQLDPKETSSLVFKIHKSMDDINAVTAQVRTQFDPNEKQAMLSKLNTTAETINATMTVAKKLVEDASPKIVSAVSHVDNTAKRLDEDISVKIAQELDKDNNTTLLGKLHISLSAAQVGMENIKQITTVGRDLFVLNQDNLQAMVDNFAETSAHLKGTAKELRRNPWRLLYTPEKNEVEYANLMESARAFSDAANSLDQANNKLSRLSSQSSGVINPEDPQVIKIREEVKKSFCQFEQAQKKLWELLKVKS
jgi:ABC-type transporter Mla subunit MlaD